MKFSCTKWGKYKLMRQQPKLVPYLPPTKIMTQGALYTLLDKFTSIMLKPFSGLKGYGVIKVSKSKNNKYVIHQENNRQVIKNSKKLFTILKKRTGSKQYIVQRWIPLATIKGQPFDVRVMVQRTKKLPWSVTGNFVKVATKGYVITNVTTQILPFNSAMETSCLHKSSSKQLLKQINKLALVVAKHLSTGFKVKNIGLDIGLDQKGTVWIIEANFKPSISPFRRLKDKSIYRRIVSFEKEK